MSKSKEFDPRRRELFLDTLKAAGILFIPGVASVPLIAKFQKSRYEKDILDIQDTPDQRIFVLHPRENYKNGTVQFLGVSHIDFNFVDHEAQLQKLVKNADFIVLEGF